MLISSTHAQAMLEERGIEPAWVERRRAAPDIGEPDPPHPDRIRAFRAVPERDGRVLRVVSVKADNATRVMTVFVDRARRRRP